MPTYTNSTTAIIKRTCRDEFGALTEKVFLPGVPMTTLEYITVSGLTKTSASKISKSWRKRMGIEPT